MPYRHGHRHHHRGRHSVSTVGRRNRSPRSSYRPFGALFGHSVSRFGYTYNDLLRLFEYGHIGDDEDDEVDAGGDAVGERATASRRPLRQPAQPSEYSRPAESVVSQVVSVVCKLQALVYDILPSTTAVFSHVIGS